MKRVELYGRVRHAVMIEGLSQREAGSLFWDRPAHGQEDVELFGATGLCPDAACCAKHLVLCRIEKRPPRLNLLAHPYLPRAEVATTSARSYMGLLKGAAP